MHWNDWFIWAWNSLARIIAPKRRGSEKSAEETARKKIEDELCEGRETPVDIQLWDEADAVEVAALPPGPEHIFFGPHEFWNCMAAQGTVGLVAVQRGSGKVAGVIVSHNMTIIRFAVTEKFRRQGIGTMLLERLLLVLSPLPAFPLRVEIPDRGSANLFIQQMFIKAGFVAMTIQRNCPEPGETMYMLECPPHIGWKRGQIYVVDGDTVRTITASREIMRT